jgi:hypothetical protein
MLRVDLPIAARVTGLGRNPVRAASFNTRSRVPAFTRSGRENTRETVLVDTPTLRENSRIDICDLVCCVMGGVDQPLGSSLNFRRIVFRNRRP